MIPKIPLSYAYAKKNWVSLATALQKNFVDQLKKKPEYKEQHAVYNKLNENNKSLYQNNNKINEFVKNDSVALR